MRLVLHLLLIIAAGVGADLSLNRGATTSAFLSSFQRIDTGVGVAQYHTSKGVSRKLGATPTLAGLKPSR